MRATAIANVNIALVKYWGKRDPVLRLPQNGSLSVTLDGLYAETTVTFGEGRSVAEGRRAGGGCKSWCRRSPESAVFLLARERLVIIRAEGASGLTG